MLQKYSVLKWYEEYRISQRRLYSFLLLLSHTGRWWQRQTETHAIPVFPTAIDEKLPLHSNRLWQRIMRFIYSSLKSFWMSLFTAISIQQPFSGNMQYWIVQWPFKTMVYYNHYICYWVIYLMLFSRWVSIKSEMENIRCLSSDLEAKRSFDVMNKVNVWFYWTVLLCILCN